MRKTTNIVLSHAEATTLLYAMRMSGDGTQTLRAKLEEAVKATRSEKRAQKLAKLSTPKC